jgi:hypothetical protein
MFKMRVALLGVLALFIVSGVSTSAASAAGPYWRVNGARLETGARQLKLQNKGVLKLITEVGKPAIEIECNRSVSEGGTIEGNGTNQGQDKGRITYTSCTTNATGCTVVEPITTVGTKSYLANAATQTGIVDVFEPTEGTTFVTITLKGTCIVAGKYAVTGKVAAETIPVEKEAQEGILNFPSAAVTTVKHEGTEKSVGLSFGGAPARFIGVYGARLATNEVYGVFQN